ncbi:MAG: hypothetical protein GY722_03310 [bacterium]|nr:hypothetical protein [bacterium]
MNIRRTLAISLLPALALVLNACDSDSPAPTTEAAVAVTSLAPVTTSTTTTTTTTTLPPTFDVAVTVTDAAGVGITDAVVIIGEEEAMTAEDGVAAFIGIPPAPISISRIGWLPTETAWDGGEAEVTAAIERRVVRALRVSSYVAADREQFDALLDLAARSTVNAFVFDTKDESSYVLYESASEFAASIGSINPMYEPTELIEAAKDAGLYTITRIVTFEDDIWVRERPDHKLAGTWADPTNRDTWEYPLELAVEACRLGFDEIQFDYVRFPAGRTAAAANARRPTTQEERVSTIQSFLTEARDLLHPMGCALSADIFAIVLSTPNDQGIGQMPEAVSAVVDAVSPMIYPSHYSDGWLGFPDPNDYPGPVVANALDAGIPRLNEYTEMRPWLQAFYYTADQILAEIEEAESRGSGWILWNAGGNYAESWLPAAES